VVYDGTGTEVSLPNDPRIDVVKEIIEEAAAKVIVFVPFKSVIPMVARALEAEGYTTAQISGETSKRNRDEIFRAFQHDKDPHVLVAQPAAMSHGLTLTAANVVCWYAPITSNDIFEQANARVVRPGQKHTTLIAMIEGTPVERRIYERLQSKQRLQGTLLDLVRAA
jgi:SNF2 family DNA or RNA helicase